MWLKKNQKPAKDDLAKPKNWGEYPYYWCSPATGGKCDGCWRQHKPSECKGTAKPTKKNKGDDNDHDNKKVTINEVVEKIQGGYETDE